MKKILETERLILRELNSNDALSFYDLNNNPNVIKYTGNLPFESVEKARDFLLSYRDYDENGFGRWAVIEKATEKFLGWCGLKYSKETDIGFRFFEEYWNKGFATESAKVCLDYGFNEFHLSKIVGRVMAENIASIKVLEKLGLVYDRECDFDGHKGLKYKIESTRLKI